MGSQLLTLSEPAWWVVKKVVLFRSVSLQPLATWKNRFNFHYHQFFLLLFIIIIFGYDRFRQGYKKYDNIVLLLPNFAKNNEVSIRIDGLKTDKIRNYLADHLWTTSYRIRLSPLIWPHFQMGLEGPRSVAFWIGLLQIIGNCCESTIFLTFWESFW